MYSCHQKLGGVESRVLIRRAGIFGGGLEVRKRAIKSEQRVRIVACRVAVITGDGILC